ncbi:hypothetical protein H2198_009518, partial [Neophaeococcomyces mojaviensis]
MEGLRSLAQEDFDQQQLFVDQAQDIQTFNITLTVGQAATISRASLTETNRVHVVNRSLAASHHSFSLRLTRICRDSSQTLLITRQNFLELVEAMQLDTAMLYHIRCNSSGFYHCESRPSNCSSQVYSYFLGCTDFRLAWTFDPSQMRSEVLFIDGGTYQSYRRDKVFHRFVEVLQLYKDYICCPQILAFAASTYLMLYIEGFISTCLQGIRRIEGFTGHGAWIDHSIADKKSDFEWILEASKQIHRYLAYLANQVRHIGIVISLMQDLKENKLKLRNELLSDTAKDAYDARLVDLETAAVTLQQRLDHAKACVIYLQERVRAQSTV